MLRITPRRAFGALCLASVLLVGAGLAASAAQSNLLGAGLRPAPAATYVIGTASGPLFYVQNNGTAPFDTFGVAGTAGVGPDAIGVLGYGASTAHANLALTGYDIGPGSVASVGYAAYPEPFNGPGSTQTTGVLGIAPDGDGVMGQTSVVDGSFTGIGSSGYGGVVGVDNSTGEDNAGVIGITTNGVYGVEGLSEENEGGGVFGESLGSGDGIDGLSFGAGYGLHAQSFGSGAAVYANGSSGDAIDAVTGGPYGLSAYGVTIGAYGVSPVQGVWGAGHVFGVVGQAAVSGGIPLELVNSTLNTVFYVSDTGNVFQLGSTYPLVATSGGAVGRTFTPKATTQTIEDSGSGAIANGAGIVRLDPAFAQLIDQGGYQVFLTPDGDCNGLYVAQKNASGFAVRELRGGRSTLAFDYRIIARQYGHAGDRVVLAANAAAFGAARLKAAPLPANRIPSNLRALLAARARPFSKGAPYDTFAIPRAAAGLMRNFGR
jgi:hypothetical protein